MRRLAAFLFCSSLLTAAILPDAIGPAKRGAVTPATLADRPVWDEMGLKTAETASYEAGKTKFSATAWQLADSTGALAAFDWQRPADATPSKAAELAAETKDALMLVHGNYLLWFNGYKPDAEELKAVVGSLRQVDTTSLPVLPGYLPAQGLIPNTERYVTGPAALSKFAPGIPVSIAAFRYGAEAQLGSFRSAKGDVSVAIFSYPTPQIAMERTPEFQKITGAYVKRSGSLVAIALAPQDADFAERLLGQVRWQGVVMRDEYVPTQRDNPGNMLLSIFVLIGILLAFAVFSGVFLGGVRALLRYSRKGEEPDAMITLHIDNR